MSRVVTILGLLGIAVLAFSGTIGHEWIYEDLGLRGWANPSPWSVGELLSPRGLSQLCYRIEALIGWTPRTVHLTSLGIHCLNALLLERVIRRLASPIVALLAMMIFLLSRIQSGTVLYAAAQPELLVGCAVLLTLLAAQPLWQWWTPVALAAGIACAILAKEAGIAIVLLVPVWYRRIGGVAWTWPVTAAAMGAVSTAWWWGAGLWRHLYYALITVPSPDVSIQQPLLGFVAIQCLALWRMLVLVVLPFGVTIDHDYELVPHVWAVLALLSAVGVAIVAWRRRRQYPTLAFTGAWVLASLLPRLLVRSSGEFLNEYQMYVPMVGVSYGFAVALVTVTEYLRRESDPRWRLAMCTFRLGDE